MLTSQNEVNNNEQINIQELAILIDQEHQRQQFNVAEIDEEQVFILRNDIDARNNNNINNNIINRNVVNVSRNSNNRENSVNNNRNDNTNNYYLHVDN